MTPSPYQQMTPGQASLSVIERRKVNEKRIRDEERLLDAMSLVFTTTSRIVSGKQATDVTITRDSPLISSSSVAMTDLENIVVNGKFFAGVDRVDDDLLYTLLRGTIYHELAHIIHTWPMMKLPSGTVQGGQFDSSVYNILEDQRIETRFSAVYNEAKLFFTAAVMFHIVEANDSPGNHTNAVWTTFLLHGRKFIPLSVREAARAKIDGLIANIDKSFDRDRATILVNNMHSYIDEYLYIVYPKDKNKGVELLCKFHADMTELTQILSQSGMYQGGLGSAAASTAAVTPSNPGIHKSTSNDNADLGKQIAESHEADADADAKAEGENSKSTGSTPGSSNEDKLVGAAEDTLNQIADDKTVIKVSKDTQRAIRHLMNSGGMVVKLDRAPSSKAAVTPSMRSSANRIAIEIQKVRSEIEEEWHHRQTAGRLNLKRSLLSNPWDMTVFDHWDSGNLEAGSVEAVVMIDLSTSMVTCIKAANEAVWSLCHGFQRAEIQTTVLGYSNSSYLLKKREERTNVKKFDSFGVISGTNPSDAYKEARRVLQSSSKPNKLCINVTDGGWTQEYICEHIIQKMNGEDGVITVLYGLSNAVRQHGSHQCMVASDVTDMNEAMRLITNIVVGIQQKVAQR